MPAEGFILPAHWKEVCQAGIRQLECFSPRYDIIIGCHPVLRGSCVQVLVKLARISVKQLRNVPFSGILKRGPAASYKNVCLKLANALRVGSDRAR